MFLPIPQPGTATELIRKNYSHLYELMNELNTAITHRRMAHEAGRDGHVESELLAAALREVIETCLTVDVVMAVDRAKLDPSKALLDAPLLERLLPSSALLWNDVLLAIRRFDENRAAGYDSRPSAD